MSAMKQIYYYLYKNYVQKDKLTHNEMSTQVTVKEKS